MGSVTDADAGSVDGRLARSQRTRLAIVDALRSLHQEGDLRPTAPRVAERAGVSLRTVWQHFEDLETLLLEAGRRDAEIVLGYVDHIDGDASLPERIRALVRQRSRMYEDLAPTWRAARLHEPFSAQIRANRDRLLQLGAEQLATLFEPELAALRDADAATTLHALQVVTSWATWESLRSDFHLPAAEAQRAVELLVERLLAAPATAAG